MYCNETFNSGTMNWILQNNMPMLFREKKGYFHPISAFTVSCFRLSYDNPFLAKAPSSRLWVLTIFKFCSLKIFDVKDKQK